MPAHIGVITAFQKVDSCLTVLTGLSPVYRSRSDEMGRDGGDTGEKGYERKGKRLMAACAAQGHTRRGRWVQAALPVKRRRKKKKSAVTFRHHRGALSYTESREAKTMIPDWSGSMVRRNVGTYRERARTCPMTSLPMTVY